MCYEEGEEHLKGKMGLGVNDSVCASILQGGGQLYPQRKCGRYRPITVIVGRQECSDSKGKRYWVVKLMGAQLHSREDWDLCPTVPRFHNPGCQLSKWRTIRSTATATLHDILTGFWADNTHGTANFAGSVGSATFGPNPVTTIEQVFLSLGNAEIYSEAMLLWDTLPKQHDIRGLENKYLDRSHRDIVQDTLGWFEDPDSELGFLIQGAAGLGKSMLAHHLTHWLHAAGHLTASMSLSTLPSDSRSPSSVLKIAARELRRLHPEAIPAILKSITSVTWTHLPVGHKYVAGSTAQAVGPTWMHPAWASLALSSPLPGPGPVWTH
ncbi:hypothetical protein FA13DRAFT_1872502 [Coprinellus micaceus]|uniref:Nephrocystin 3-like N-terminal domain-containing protein n=1 Tax=Coprinellus micaceus TaxID=71717 RepID=A0A4Y7S7L7_COPMI|nr:hypothetical protein FA13DRAFT_1872502 [Coprinellus micaceus]